MKLGIFALTSLGVRLRGSSDADPFSPTSSTSSTVASLMPNLSTVPTIHAPGYRLFLKREASSRWSLGTSQPTIAADLQVRST